MKVNKKKGTCVHNITEIFDLTLGSGIQANRFAEILDREIKKCKEIGFEVEIKMFEDTKDLDYSTIAKEIIRSGKDRNINGIILQLPLPLHLEPYKLQILNKIPKFKPQRFF